MTDRKKQIEDGFTEKFCEPKYSANYAFERFRDGAEWADQNPHKDKSMTGVQYLTSRVVEALEEQRKCELANLKADHKAMRECLKLYRGIPGSDCDHSTTKWSAADGCLDNLSVKDE